MSRRAKAGPSLRSGRRLQLAAIIVTMLVAVAAPAHAHRLDEYLQATTISVGKDRVVAQIRLTPGVAVFPSVLADIDTNGDGRVSDGEQRSYAERILRELSLSIDGTRLPLRLMALKFASLAEMQEGRGDMQIDFDAAVPAGGKGRRLMFENRHAPKMSVYLVNALVSTDPDIRLTHQNRSYEQTSYQMDYTQAGVPSRPLLSAWWPLSLALLAVAAVLSGARFMPQFLPFVTRT